MSCLSNNLFKPFNCYNIFSLKANCITILKYGSKKMDSRWILVEQFNLKKRYLSFLHHNIFSILPSLTKLIEI